MKLSHGHFLWNFLDEHVVIEQILLVHTEEILVEGKRSALLAINLEVLHTIDCLSEFFWVLDLDNARVVWSCGVSLDLRDFFKWEAYLFFEGFRKFY